VESQNLIPSDLWTRAGINVDKRGHITMAEAKLYGKEIERLWKEWRREATKEKTNA